VIALLAGLVRGTPTVSTRLISVGVASSPVMRVAVLIGHEINHPLKRRQNDMQFIIYEIWVVYHPLLAILVDVDVD
jgi:hypothetical protein